MAVFVLDHGGLLLLSGMLACAMQATLAGGAPPALAVDTHQRAQTIEGFGASGAWWAQHVGGWPKAKRERIIHLLYSPRGIGLSIYRHNIGAGDGEAIRDRWRRTESFEVAPGKFDWSRDAHATRILKEICAAGVKRVVLCAYSAPARMTRSGSVAGHPKGRSNLRDDMHDAFADYLVAIAAHFVRDEGIPIRALSPINEPQWKWGTWPGQEGCHYELDECVSVVKAVVRKVKAARLDVRVEAIEAGEWTTAGRYAQALFADPEIRAGLDGFAVHSYWSQWHQKKRLRQWFAKHHPRKKLRMTEWCEMKNGRDLGMDAALVLANVVHDDLVFGGVVSWCAWLAVSRYDYRDGLLYVNEEEQEILESKRFWALGNWSRFVRPGFARVGAVCEARNVWASAFLGNEGRRLVVVALRKDKTPVEIALRPGREFQAAAVAAYETSDAHSLTRVAAPPPTGTCRLAPNSITTLVFDRR